MIANPSSRHRLLRIAAILLIATRGITSFADSKTESLTDALKQFIWTWNGASMSTQVIFRADGTLLTREKQRWQWTAKDAQTVTVTLDAGRKLDLAFNAAFTSFTNADPLSAPVKGERQQVLSAQISSGNGSPQKPAAAETKRTPDPKQMTLAQDWMPRRMHTREGEMKSMETFCRTLVDKGKDTIPTKIWGPLTWLMPVREAIKGLPKGARLQGNETLENLWFPQDSLHLWTMTLVGFEFDDRCNKFNYIQFICDRDDRVIGVQLIHSKPSFVSWKAPGPEGVSVPYYDFIMDRWNATRSQCVPYQIEPADKGVLLIKTALYDAPTPGMPPYAPGPCPGYILLPNRKYMKSVHLYLTTPLATKVLEIIQTWRDAETKGGRLGGGGISGGTGSPGK